MAVLDAAELDLALQVKDTPSPSRPLPLTLPPPSLSPCPRPLSLVQGDSKSRQLKDLQFTREVTKIENFEKEKQ
eukprot:4874747-Prymnesium_polylepis.1